MLGDESAYCSREVDHPARRFEHSNVRFCARCSMLLNANILLESGYNLSGELSQRNVSMICCVALLLWVGVCCVLKWRNTRQNRESTEKDFPYVPLKHDA